MKKTLIISSVLVALVFGIATFALVASVSPEAAVAQEIDGGECTPYCSQTTCIVYGHSNDLRCWCSHYSCDNLAD